MKNVLILLLLVLSVPLCGMASTLYAYTGATLTCRASGTCPVLADAITLTLEFSSPLATDTEYINPEYVSEYLTPTGKSAGGMTYIGSLLTGWTITDGVHTITSADANTTFIFDLALDATGAVESWYIAADTDPTASGDMLLLGTLNSYEHEDDALYEERLAGGGTDTSWWVGMPTTDWKVSTTSEAPEPGTMGLLALSLSALAIWRRRQAR